MFKCTIPHYKLWHMVEDLKPLLVPDVDHAVPDEGGKLDWSSDIFSKQDSQFYLIKTFIVIIYSLY